MHADPDGTFRTREKLLTRRGVLWLGQTCNLRCHFCYFLDRIEQKDHPEHPFMELEKAKAICHALRFKYGNTSVDIQGGEPTIWRHIDELVVYCRDIGLHPTLITNALALASSTRRSTSSPRPGSRRTCATSRSAWSTSATGRACTTSSSFPTTRTSGTTTRGRGRRSSRSG